MSPFYKMGLMKPVSDELGTSKELYEPGRKDCMAILCFLLNVSLFLGFIAGFTWTTRGQRKPGESESSHFGSDY